ncbi:ATP-dependent DNA helicase PIF1-like [Senna tora]|uniref:ATP-dependent DNA helicase PIF1-like n=1 Tax=Senna tora TaxID=362788 RepID=A0A834X1C8_9FABA|nr:ATP-dependent DNA helicase PIF1-like [Senna tora]
MRLGTGSSSYENQVICDLADWVLKIGNGDIGDEINDEESEINIPDDILTTNFKYHVKAIVENTYPLFLNNFDNQEYIRDRAILAPTLDDVATINNYMLSLLPGEEVIYLSSDSICIQNNHSQVGHVYTTEFLNTLSGFGFPYHELKLKVGAPVMLMHNIDNSMGLCNGTRLIVVRLCKHVIEALILSGKHAGEQVIIARMVITPSDSRLPFRFQRRQFPVILSFAMTINNSQGQTLSNVAMPPRNQLISAINPLSDDLSLKVRVLMLWFMPPYNNNSISSASNGVQIQMVLCDREKNTIAASVKSIYLNKFKSVLKEGGVYVLSKFAIGINGGNFQYSTRVVPAVDDSSIHHSAFDWIPFDSITIGQAHPSTLVGMLICTL